MPDSIKDGEGTGREAGVDLDNRLRVVSKTESYQHILSAEKQQAYQVIGTATLASGTVTVLHIKNISSSMNMVITYVRHQVLDQAGGAAFPNASNYFQIALERTYASGGSTSTPVNIFVGSGNTPEVTVYQGAPTLAGTAMEIDRYYTKAEGDMNTFNKEGALVIPPNKTVEFSYVGDQTSGTIYTRVSFLMEAV